MKAEPFTKVRTVRITLENPDNLRKLNDDLLHRMKDKVQDKTSQHGHGIGTSSSSSSSSAPAPVDPYKAKRAFLKRWAVNNYGSNSFYTADQVAKGQCSSPGFRAPTADEMRQLFKPGNYAFCTGQKNGKDGLWVAVNKEELSQVVNGNNVLECLFFPYMGWIDETGRHHNSGIVDTGLMSGYYWTSSRDSEKRPIGFSLDINGSVQEMACSTDPYKFLVRGIKP